LERIGSPKAIELGLVDPKKHRRKEVKAINGCRVRLPGLRLTHDEDQRTVQANSIHLDVLRHSLVGHCVFMLPKDLCRRICREGIGLTTWFEL
jgi:hypothetical protein